MSAFELADGAGDIGGIIVAPSGGSGRRRAGGKPSATWPTIDCEEQR